MAITYTGISSIVTAGASTASVTFSSIPQTYTDLELRVSGSGGQGTSILASFNSTAISGNSIYLINTTTQVEGYTSTAGKINNLMAQNVYSAGKIYIKQYRSTTNSRGFFTFTGAGDSWTMTGNASTATTAIASITLTADVGSGWAAGSRIDLYGILKA